MRPTFLLACLAFSLSCGACSSLEESRSSNGNGSGGTGGEAGQGQGGSGGTAGGGGAGGSPSLCNTFAWAGDPLLLNLGNDGELSQLQLLQALPDKPTLTWVERANTATVHSLTLDGWGAWPPAVDPTRTHFSTFGGYELDVSPGRPGLFLFAGRNLDGFMTFTFADPNADGFLPEEKLLGGPYEAHSAAHSPFADVLVHGTPQQAFALLRSDQPNWLGANESIACGDAPILTDSIALADGGFLVVSSSKEPFDECLGADVLGSPTTLQVHRLDEEGVTQAHFIERDKPINRIQLAPDDGGAGAWLLYRSQGDAEGHVVQLNSEGFQSYSYASVGNALYEEAVADWSGGFAVVTTWPGSTDNETPPFVLLTLNTLQPAVNALSLETSVVQGTPTLLASQDQRSFLLAWHVDEATVGLLRGECF